MPVLSRGNFNPEFIGVLSRKQNAAKIKITVTYQREMDRYTNFWNQLHWIGNNYKDENRATHTSIYEVDWENHTVKLIDTQSKEKIL